MESVFLKKQNGSLRKKEKSRVVHILCHPFSLTLSTVFMLAQVKPYNSNTAK